MIKFTLTIHDVQECNILETQQTKMPLPIVVATFGASFNLSKEQATQVLLIFKTKILLPVVKAKLDWRYFGHKQRTSDYDQIVAY